MASTYSTNLKIELIGTGEQSGTWGATTNTNFGTALEQAIVGYGNPNFTSDADLTLTLTDSNAAQTARAFVLNVTSSVSLSTTRELVVPTIQKPYIIRNNTTGGQSITVKTSGGTGITVPTTKYAFVYADGTNVVSAIDHIPSLTLGTALPVASGGTGITSFGTGVATALGQNVTGSGGIVLATSPTLTTPALGTPASGVLTNATGLPLTTGVTGTLGVSNGGTGATSLTANNVILGNGTSAVQFVAPGTSGNVLTSTGTTWQSTAPSVTVPSFGAVGSIVAALCATTSDLGAPGTTVAGSNLRYSYSPITNYNAYDSYVTNSSNSYNGGGTSLSGTWMKVSTGVTWRFDGDNAYYWYPHEYVRTA